MSNWYDRSMNSKISIFLSLLFTVVVAFGQTKNSPATFTSSCTCNGARGEDRWPAKTDTQQPPNKLQITAITPSQMLAWPGVGVSAKLTKQSPRAASEQRWFALTGRIAGIKVERDGDIHLELVDANDNKQGIVGAEIPAAPTWCELRKLAFSYTNQKFPFKVSSSKPLALTGTHVITVTGKAFYDVDHAPKNRSNQRVGKFPPGYSVWEIHPVMIMK